MGELEDGLLVSTYQKEYSNIFVKTVSKDGYTF